MKKKTPICLLMLLCILSLTGCYSTTYLSNGYGTRYYVSVNAWGNYNLVGKTFYITSGDENVSDNDLEFAEYKSYLEESLVLSGAKPTKSEYEKKNADMIILMSYGITNESYNETVPIPIWGPTGIASVSTTSTTRGSAYGTASGSAYGSAQTYGNTTYGSAYGSASGSAYGSSTTNTRTNVRYNYGVTGVTNVNRHVENYRRFINIYAFDNKHTDNPTMLWKTNLVSEGSSSDARKVYPYMFYCAWGSMGVNTGEWKEATVFENDYSFVCWKDKLYSKYNVTSWPRYSRKSSSIVDVAFVIRNPRETIVCIRKSGCPDWYSFSNEIYITWGDNNIGKCQISKIDGYEFGTTIHKECGNRYYLLHFPAGIPSFYGSFNIIEYTNKKHTETGFVWQELQIK